MSKVPVQKGPINPNPHTQKNMPRGERAVQDAEMNRMRQSGKDMDLRIPKQK